MMERHKLSFTERARWGTCPACGALHGQPCDKEGEIVKALTPEDAHFGRLLSAPVVVDWTCPLFHLEEHLNRQMAWSRKTFGPGERNAGIADHIAKELREVLDSGGALEEWIDVIILAFDGAWRSGATPLRIIAALSAKQAKNEARKWPDWRTAEPGKAIEHDRTGETPQTPVRPERLKYTAREAEQAFEWLRGVSLADDAPAAAGIALCAWADALRWAVSAGVMDREFRSA